MTAVSTSAPPAADARRTPYQGLTPYREEDAEFFFGRDRERDVIVNNLLSSRLTLLYGPSGVGKSSLLRAGVARKLRTLAEARLAETGSPELVPVVFAAWRDEPRARLAAAMRTSFAPLLPHEATAPPASADAQPLDRLIDAWANALDADLLFVFDQFEEYFMYEARADPDGAFARDLVHALNKTQIDASFLVSIREDALAKLDRFKRSVPFLFDNYLRVEHLDFAAAREAMTEPVKRFNARADRSDRQMQVDAGLVEAVLRDVQAGKVIVGESGRGGVAGAEEARVETPYLQLVMDRLWREAEARGETTLRAQTLEDLGGAKQIVEKHLDEAMASLTRREKTVAALLFHQLVTPGGTKIAHTVSDLAQYAEGADVEPILEKLSGSEARIVRPVPPPPGKTDQSYEIFHDVLASPILQWRAKYVAERQSRKQRNRAAVVASVLALVAGVLAALAVLAFGERDQARKLEAIARSEADAARASAQLSTDPVEALRGSVTAMSLAATPQAENTLRDALSRPVEEAVMHASSGPPSALDVSRDGKFLLVVGSGTASVWRAGGGGRVARFGGAHDDVFAAAMSPDATRVATAPYFGDVVEVWKVGSHAPPTRLVGDTSFVSDIAFSPDGTRIVTASDDGTARVWNADTGKQVALIRERDSVVAAAFSPDGKRIVTGNERDFEVWRLHPRRRVFQWTMDGAVESVAFSADGRFVTATDATGRAEIIRVDGEDLFGLEQSKHTVVSPNGKYVASAIFKGLVGIWATDGDQKLVALLQGHAGEVTSIEFSRDGSEILTAGSDATARVWDTRSGNELAVVHEPAAVESAVFAGDGIAAASDDGTLRIWRPTLPFRTVRRVATFAFGPGGDVVATGSPTGAVAVWNVHTGSLLHAFRGGRQPIDTVRVSRDGSVVVAADRAHFVRVWSAAQRKPILSFRDHSAREFDRRVASIALSPSADRVLVAFTGGDAIVRPIAGGTRVDLHDSAGIDDAEFDRTGTRVVTADGERTAALWDATTGKRLHVLHGHRTWVGAAVFSPVADLVATSSGDSTARLWNARTGKQLAVLRGHSGPVESVAFSDDGNLLVTAGSDATARVWRVPSGESVAGLRGHTDVVDHASFSPDGKLVLTSSRDGTTRLWDISSGRQLATFRGGPASFTPDGKAIAVEWNGELDVYPCVVCGTWKHLMSSARDRIALVARR